MSLDEYQYYCRCRQASFVNRQNRARFLSWIALPKSDLAPDSGSRVVALLGLIAHDHIGAIVELGRGLQEHPGPLTFAQVQDAIRAITSIQYDIGPRTGPLQMTS